jgi:trimethylamine---corrinoid protein Co-methyltransferase
MFDRMQTLTEGELNLIHTASMEILSTTGVAFNEPDAISLFGSRGFAVDGKLVRMKESQVQQALSLAPSRFEVTARNPAKSVWVGENDWVFVPTYGAPFMVSPDGIRRPGRMQDYDTFCKLVQTSPHINMNGFKHVEPQDVPSKSAYLDMLLSNIVLCDKPYMGSTDTRQATRDSLEMAGMVFGGKEALREMPVIVNLINSLSPLQYSAEMAGAILELAPYRQPLLIANMIMGGTSGPVTLPELLVLMNAEILAGLVLAQLAGPGTPVIYGTTSCPTNMRTGAATVGTPETAIISSMATQLARFYHLPCRTGGSLTDAGIADAQALAEGALVLSTAVRSGANFILHACGMIGGYIGNSLEKWLIDEELCGMVRRMMTPLEISRSAMDTAIIGRAGIGGNYLMQPETLKHCRTAFFHYALYRKEDRGGQAPEGLTTITQEASDQLLHRLSNYEKPDIDPELETDLAQFVVTRRKNG